MNAEDFVLELGEYDKKLGGVLERFERGHNSLHINREDDAVFRQAIVELRDLLDDALGPNAYSTQIANLFDEGIANYSRSPSYRSVESILGVVRAAATRLRRRPALVLTERPLDPSTTSHIELFVSHSSEDAGVAAALIGLLRPALNLPAEAVRCTSVDGYRLPGGVSTDEQLRQEVHGATAFVGIVSARSARSAYVLFELGARWGARRHLLPLLAPGAEASTLSGPLAGLNALRADNEAQLHQLVEEIGKQLKRSVGPVASYLPHLQRLAMLPAGSSEEAAPGEVASPREPVSKEARVILSAAARDQVGAVFFVETNQGLSATADGRELVQTGDARSEARFRRSLNELLSAGLLESRGGDGSLLHVTDAGFMAADQWARS